MTPASSVALLQVLDSAHHQVGPWRQAIEQSQGILKNLAGDTACVAHFYRPSRNESFSKELAKNNHLECQLPENQTLWLSLASEKLEPWGSFKNDRAFSIRGELSKGLFAAFQTTYLPLFKESPMVSDSLMCDEVGDDCMEWYTIGQKPGQGQKVHVTNERGMAEGSFFGSSEYSAMSCTRYTVLTRSFREKIKQDQQALAEELILLKKLKLAIEDPLKRKKVLEFKSHLESAKWHLQQVEVKVREINKDNDAEPKMDGATFAEWQEATEAVIAASKTLEQALEAAWTDSQREEIIRRREAAKRRATEMEKFIANVMGNKQGFEAIEDQLQRQVRVVSHVDCDWQEAD